MTNQLPERFTPSIDTISLRDEQYEPHPRDEDVLERVYRPIEVNSWGAFIVRNYTTPKAARAAALKQLQSEPPKLVPSAKSTEPSKTEAMRLKRKEDIDIYGRSDSDSDDTDISSLDPISKERMRFKNPSNVNVRDEVPSTSAGPSSPTNKRRYVEAFPEDETSEETLEDVIKLLEKEDEESSKSVDEESAPNINDPHNLYYYEEDFRLKPADFIIFVKPKLLPQTMTEDYVSQKEWREQLNDGSVKLSSMVKIYSDPFYFHDNGQFRSNYLDTTPLEKGDMVVRIGYFTPEWFWQNRGSVNIYMYWPGFIAQGSNDTTKVLNPWYWISHGTHISTNPLSIVPDEAAPLNMPLFTTSPNFRLREGDLVIHHISDNTKEPPWNHRLEAFVWNPLLHDIHLQNRLVKHLDKVLRHGINFTSKNEHGVRRTIMYVELYYYHVDQEKQTGVWKFLGRHLESFTYWPSLEPAIMSITKCPLPGDILFEMIPNAKWKPRYEIGGLVTLHKWEAFIDYGREVRKFVWYRDKGRWGHGGNTIAIRFGSFDEDSNEWVWTPSEYVHVYLLNERGSAWRLGSSLAWPFGDWRPKPSYNWKLPEAVANLKNMATMPRSFGPIQGDLILRFGQTQANEEWKQNPIFVGSSQNSFCNRFIIADFFGPHIKIRGGDLLIRSGFEKNTINPKWTNATVEIYNYNDSHEVPERLSNWRFLGRDAYIYGTNYLSGGLEGVTRSGFGDLPISRVALLNSLDARLQFEKTLPFD